MVSDANTECRGIFQNTRETSNTLYVVIQNHFWGPGRAMTLSIKEPYMVSVNIFFKAIDLVWSQSFILALLK